MTIDNIEIKVRQLFEELQPKTRVYHNIYHTEKVVEETIRAYQSLKLN